MNLSSYLVSFLSLTISTLISNHSYAKGDSANTIASTNDFTHCEQLQRKQISGTARKQEAEFEYVSVPCHTHVSHDQSKKGAGETKQSLSERKAKT